MYFANKTHLQERLLCS